MLWVFILAWYAAASVATFVVYAWDKRQAKRCGRRVPEMTLQMLALLGGWPGAHAARMVLRHKTRKRGFTLVLWLITLMHVAVVSLVVWRSATSN